MSYIYLKLIVAVIVLLGGLWLLFKPDRDAETTKEYYTAEEAESFTENAAAAFGEDLMVFHERISPEVHIDILVFEPTEQCPFHTVCTMGVGAHCMPVLQEEWEKEIPEGAPERALLFPGCDRVELMLYLPADWRPLWMDETATEEAKQRSFWPIKLLKDAARFMVNNDTWFAFGHTYAQEERAPFAQGTPYCAAVLFSPLPDCLRPGFTLHAGEKEVSVLQVLPLTAEEHDAVMEGNSFTWLRTTFPADTKGMQDILAERLQRM